MKVEITRQDNGMYSVINLDNGIQVLVPSSTPVVSLTGLLKTPELVCYQCDTSTTWLAPDSRCGECTGYSPEEIRGE